MLAHRSPPPRRAARGRSRACYKQRHRAPAGETIMRRAIGVAIVLAWVCGCGSSTTGFPDSGMKVQPPLEEVAMNFATAQCDRQFACMPYATETRAFGDTVGDCITQQTGYQKRSLSAPGVSGDYSGILKCIAQMKAASCQQFLDSTVGGDPKAMPDCTAFTPG